MAKGTQQATAQQIPTSAIITVACQTLVMKKVVNMRRENRKSAEVQMFRRMKGTVKVGGREIEEKSVSSALRFQHVLPPCHFFFVT